MGRKYFGTDGIRGKVGEFPVTADFLLKLGWAAGRVFASEGNGFVLVGKDTRISGYMFESALEAGLSAAGVDTRMLGPMPTPGVAYLTRTLRAKAGIVISASHNPYYDNGVKFFSVQGTKLPDDIEEKIEHYIDSPMTTVESSELGKAKRVVDASGRYIEFCKASIPTRFDFTGMKVVVDCANGATYHIAPHVFSEVGAEVIVIGAEPNGLNINDECGATKPQKLVAAVLANQADIGIALDGDGDRLIMVDHKGEIVDGDELLYVIAKSRLSVGQLSGPVVGTLMTNLGMEHGLKSDGIIAALQIMAEMHDTGKSLTELKSGMQKYPQVLINIKTGGAIDIDNDIVLQKAVSTVENKLGNKGRVLLRASGTEPLIRVMVEGESESLVNNLAQELAEVVKKLIVS